MRISKNKFVSATYDLYVGEGEERELMESATEDRPLQFIFGMGSMLPAFEKEINELEEGSKFEFTLTAENAYGERIEENLVELPKSIFEVNGKFDDEYVVEGVTLPMMDSNGQRMNGSVYEVKEDVVVMDFNHPLAGETLHFSGQIIDVHEPTAEEIAAINQAMGMGGCGCGCEDQDCSGCGEEHTCGGGHSHDDECGCGHKH